MLSDEEINKAAADGYEEWRKSGRSSSAMNEMMNQAIARAAYERGKQDASPARAEIEAAIRQAWNHFGSIDHITRKLFKEDKA